MLQQQQNHQNGSDTDLTQLRKQRETQVEARRTEPVQDLEQASVPELIELIQKESRVRRRRTIVVLGGFACVVVLCLVMAIVFHKQNMFTFFGGFSGLIGAALAATKQHKRAAEALARRADISHLPVLVDTLEIPDAEVRSTVMSTLTGLLPQLRASDSARLTSANRKQLRSELSWRTTMRGCTSQTRTTVKKSDGTTVTTVTNDQSTMLTNFKIAILKALQQVGDESFLDIVTHMANGASRTRANADGERLRAAAAECLPYLRQCIERRHQEQELLRASSATLEVHPETLLRPASSARITNAAEMLRPSTSPSDFSQ